MSDDDNIQLKEISQIQLGDVSVASSREDLNSCFNTAKKLLDDKTIQKYLSTEIPKKRMLGL